MLETFKGYLSFQEAQHELKRLADKISFIDPVDLQTKVTTQTLLANQIKSARSLLNLLEKYNDPKRINKK